MASETAVEVEEVILHCLVEVGVAAVAVPGEVLVGDAKGGNCCAKTGDEAVPEERAEDRGAVEVDGTVRDTEGGSEKGRVDRAPLLTPATVKAVVEGCRSGDGGDVTYRQGVVCSEEDVSTRTSLRN